MAELSVVLSEAKDLTPAPDSVFAARVWSFREVLRLSAGLPRATQDDSELFSCSNKLLNTMALCETAAAVLR
jgi:hypothetical protein